MIAQVITFIIAEFFYQLKFVNKEYPLNQLLSKQGFFSNNSNVGVFLKDESSKKLLQELDSKPFPDKLRSFTWDDIDESFREG